MAEIKLHEYGRSIAYDGEAYVRHLVAGSVGQWEYVEWTGRIRCVACADTVAVSALLARCRCDDAKDEAAWRAHFGVLAEAFA